MIRILIGDCVQRMKELPDNSVDSVVCDPPYHLTSIVKRFGGENAAPAKVGKTGAYARASKGFMGQTWDGGDVAFQPETWAEVLRVLKPGGHLVAFSGTRTYHRMAVAIEDAGFEVRDCIFYHYGSGFPKSHNVFKRLAAADNVCLCDKSRLSSHHATDENLHRLQEALDAKGSLPSGSQCHLREVLHGGASGAEGEGATEPSQDSGHGELHGLRQGIRAPSVLAQEGQTTDVQQSVQRASASAEPEALFGEHEGSEAGAEVRASESGMEGRGLPQADARQLSGREVSACAEMGTADGEGGRLHHAAPASDGADVRLPADADGSGEPQGPQSDEQSPEQPRAVADERGPQAWGGWPVCGGCRKPIIPEGLGSALKPATEPICLARKPLSEKSIAANVLKHGTGALNIDGCRIGNSKDVPASASKTPNNIYGAGMTSLTGGTSGSGFDPNIGRWPANLCHDGSDEVVAGFPADAGGAQQNRDGSKSGGIWSESTGSPAGPQYADSGSAARFFYCAKSSSEERGEGNNHPTVKPVSLMRWLVRLVTPKGGTVLDPFMGSGSTGLACDAEQFDFIGCELSPEYAAIAERRIRNAAGMFAQIEADKFEAAA